MGVRANIHCLQVSLSSVRVDASGVAERSGELWVIEDPEAARAIANRVRALAASRKRFSDVSLAVRWLAKHAGLPSLRPSPVGRPDRGSAVWDGHAVMLKNRYITPSLPFPLIEIRWTPPPLLALRVKHKNTLTICTTYFPRMVS